LTTPVPDSGPSKRGRGWSGHQQGDPEWYEGPLYDDTGWHPDLSDVNGQDDQDDEIGPPGARPAPDQRHYRDPAAPRDSAFPYESGYDGNGVYPAEPQFDAPTSGRGRSADRRAGRHARRDSYEPEQRGYPGYAEPGPRFDYQGYPQPQRDYQDYQDPPARRDYHDYPEPGARRDYQDPLAPPGQQGYPDPRQQRDYHRGPDVQPPPAYPEPGQRGYPDPMPGRDYRESPQVQPRGDYAGPHAPGQSGYTAAEPERDPSRYQPSRAPDGYWSMSDPAASSDPQRPVISPFEQERPAQPAGPDQRGSPHQRGSSRQRGDSRQRGESGFLRYQDRPIYIDPPGQPYTEQTRILPALWAAEPAPDPAAAAGEVAEARRATGSVSIVRSSGVMAVGTLASRLTGFIRTLVQVYALGTLALSTVFNNANTLPNVVYNLALGGILTSVIVPLIVNAAKRESDGGEAYDQRMFTLVTGALLGITVVATLATAPLVDLYKGDISGSNLHLLVIFAYFFIPQIFFYGMSSLIGAILNARGSFAAPMWTPVVNNVVVIAVLLMFLVTARPALAGSSHPQVSGNELLLLGVGTTLGIAAQTAALVPALRKVGFRWRPRWDFRREEASEIGRMGGWMFGYIAATQVAFLVTTNICNVAQPKSGYTAYTNAWQLFQLPYAVVGISVITALLPRMSANASERRFSLVRDDFSSGVRLASVIVVPCSLILAALGPGLALVFFDHGRAATSGGQARADYIGVVFAVFCLGLLPYMLFQLQLRVFYALHDSKTPALIGLATMVLNIVANVIALEVLPSRDVVAGLGVGFGLANLLGTFLAWRILSRRLQGLDGRAIGGTLLKMHAAAIPGALFAITVGLMVTDALTGGRTGAAITIVVGGGGALLLYVMFARALRVTELASLSRTVMSRLGR
jgi:murein biosynthesis integral membrane protein MurJ